MSYQVTDTDSPDYVMCLGLGCILRKNCTRAITANKRPPTGPHLMHRPESFVGMACGVYTPDRILSAANAEHGIAIECRNGGLSDGKV